MNKDDLDMAKLSLKEAAPAPRELPAWSEEIIKNILRFLPNFPKITPALLTTRLLSKFWYAIVEETLIANFNKTRALELPPFGLHPMPYALLPVSSIPFRVESGTIYLTPSSDTALNFKLESADGELIEGEVCVDFALQEFPQHHQAILNALKRFTHRNIAVDVQNQEIDYFEKNKGAILADELSTKCALGKNINARAQRRAQFVAYLDLLAVSRNRARTSALRFADCDALLHKINMLILQAKIDDASLPGLLSCGPHLTRFPKEIIINNKAFFSKLTVLEIQFTEIKALPEEIGELRSLQRVNLSYNRLNYLTRDIRKLKELRELHVENNNLYYLPEEISELPNLRTIWANNNQLDRLPTTLPQLQFLSVLFLNGNKFTTIPDEVFMLPSLQSFGIKNEHLPTLPYELKQAMEVRKMNKVLESQYRPSEPRRHLALK